MPHEIVGGLERTDSVASGEIAKNVYDVLPVAKDMKQVDLGIDGLFIVENGSRFQGKSGCIFFNAQTGFGYLAKGVSERANEALVAIRGTALHVDCAQAGGRW